uniref:Uncharacterized protein n=1 Tax=Rhizophora mucronata TaxID=61149 RepID=A0A2P2NNP5_RHIMU
MKPNDRLIFEYWHLGKSVYCLHRTLYSLS